MTPPTLTFRVAGIPPRRTHQGGVRYRRDPDTRAGLRVFIDEAHRAEAWMMESEFRRQLPAGWIPRKGAVQVEIILAYPARKSDRLQPGQLAKHDVRPDCDNLAKAILDALVRAGTMVDDGQITDLCIRKRRSLAPFWEVRVWFEAAKPSPAASKKETTLPGLGL